MFQVLAPRLRLEVPPDVQLFAREIKTLRCFPEVRRVVDVLYAELARTNAAADSAFERDATWPPGTFWERRETNRLAATLPRLDGATGASLLAEFPHDHDYRAIVDVPARFASHSVALPEVALARLHGAWTRGVSRLVQGEQALVDFLVERVRAHGGETLLTQRAARVEQKRGRATGVLVDGDEDTTGVGFVLTDHTTRALVDLTADFDPPRGALAGVPHLVPAEWRFVVSIVVRDEGLPAPLGVESFLLPDSPRGGRRPEGHEAAWSPVVHLQRSPEPCGIEGATLLVADALVPESAARPMRRAAGAPVLRAIESRLPFVGAHYLLRRLSPRRPAPLGPYRSGARRDVNRARGCGRAGAPPRPRPMEPPDGGSSPRRSTASPPRASRRRSGAPSSSSGRASCLRSGKRASSWRRGERGPARDPHRSPARAHAPGDVEQDRAGLRSRRRRADQGKGFTAPDAWRSPAVLLSPAGMGSALHRIDDASPAPAGPCALVVGNFDGVHRGHAAVLGEAVEAARAAGIPARVLTFDPHPAAVVGRGAPPRLTALERRAELMLALGVERVWVRRFDLAFAGWTAERFVRELVAGALDARLVVVGQNFRFGAGRKGDLGVLRELGASLGFDVRVHGTACDDRGPYSSTRAREAVAARRARRGPRACSAARTSSRASSSKAIAGAARSASPRRTSRPSPSCFPRTGIYAVRVERLDGGGPPRPLGRGVANVGVRPTVRGSGARTVETHLLDASRDLYGARLRLQLVARLRSEMRFGGLDELKAQIARDCEDARGLVAPAA